MKTDLHYAQSGTLRSRRRRPGAAGFTLVELLTVIAIIVLLVGITIGILSFAQTKAANSKAQGQMELIITGLALYEKEYYEYPEPADNTGKGAGGAKALYQALSGDGDNFIVMGTGAGSSASTGKPGSTAEVLVEGIDPEANKHGLVAKGTGGGYQLADPFGQPWFYRKYVKDDGGDETNNRTYDLWSVGTDRKAKNEAKWVKNW